MNFLFYLQLFLPRSISMNEAHVFNITLFAYSIIACKIVLFVKLFSSRFYIIRILLILNWSWLVSVNDRFTICFFSYAQLILTVFFFSFIYFYKFNIVWSSNGIDSTKNKNKKKITLLRRFVSHLINIFLINHLLILESKTRF